jgi:hypothetical protein
MLNNKYLAIVLAIAAVLVVFYQVFLRKPAKSVRRPARPAAEAAAPAGMPPAGTQTAQTPAAGPRGAVPPAGDMGPSAPAGTGSQEEGLVIDNDSPILLKRVYENPMEPYPRRDLPPEFGRPIFSPPEPEAKPMARAAETKDVQFRLDSIIIDKDRQLAVINNTILFAGDFIHGAQVVNIRKRNVLLKLKEENILLSTSPVVRDIRLIAGKGEGGKGDR